MYRTQRRNNLMSDITINANTVVPSATATIARGIAGAAISAGQTVYADATDSNKIKLAANTSAATAAVVGVAVNSAPVAGQPVEYVTAGDITLSGAPLLAATVYVLGSGAGGISIADELHSSSGTRRGTVVGIGTSTTVLRVGLVASGVLNP
jgi:hypothetical protein